MGYVISFNKEAEIMKCAIYTRVSTDNQAEQEFSSCEAQGEKIRSFINSQDNMEVFKVYSDAGFTGASLNRPALNEMLADIKQNKIDLVISYKIDRLTRSPKDFYQLIELFEKHGVDFISVTERFDTSTPSGRLLRNIMLTFAQFERELASERTRDKMFQRAQKGMWNGGIVPYGYKAENKRLVIDEEEAKVVKEIYERYITSRSLSNVYNGLKEKGIEDRKGLIFSKSAIFHILRNPVYIGKILYAGKFYQGLHQPIISEEMFRFAQEIHKKKRRTMRLYKDYLLAGLVKCQECGSFMTPCHTNKKKQGKRNRYYYYRCTTTLKRDWDSCQTKLVNANRLEDYVFENLERISLDKHYIDSLIFRLNNTLSGDRVGLEPSQVCSESAKISPEIFGQTLRLFVKGITERKGIEKNLWAKKFIKDIIYSKSDIQINVYYSNSFENSDFSSLGGQTEKIQGGIAPQFPPHTPNFSVCNMKNGSSGGTRTPDPLVNSQLL
ncbi:MAG: recombinase family protein, partial [Caldimicrobium thiodismutans]